MPATLGDSQQVASQKEYALGFPGRLLAEVFVLPVLTLKLSRTFPCNVGNRWQVHSFDL